MLALICILSAANSVHAVQSNVVKTDNVSAKLISEYQSVKAGQSFSVIFRIDIRDGWHTYWRNPGDSGQATVIKWLTPDGITANEIEWPYPERQYVGPVANYGYHGVALHRVQFDISPDWPAGKEISMVANATWLVCEEECIPEKGRFEMIIPSADDAVIATQHITDFATIKEQLPAKLELSSSYQYSNDGQIRFEFNSAPEFRHAKHIEYFPYDWGVLQAPAKQTVVIDPAFVSISSQKSDLTFTTPISGVLVVTGQEEQQRAFEVQSNPGTLVLQKALVLPEASAAGVVSQESLTVKQNSISLLSALLFAFLGGLILNLMPCVFPVLSMKAMSLVKHANEPSVVIKRHGLVYTFGVLASFILLGVCLLIFQATGQQIGWGFQLQSPLFVSVIVIVLFVLGLSLSGFVEIGASLMGVGSGLAQQSGYKGSFFTGVLAVIVATPCTAPFMGPAVGFALTQSPLVTLLVLSALGFGLALPYLLLCYFPLLSTRLPKPGAWMRTLQQFLAFPMYATAAWLIWVLGLQTGINYVFAVLISCILVALAIWLWQNSSSASRHWRIIGRIIVLFVLIAIAVMLLNVPKATLTTQLNNSDSSGANYQAFSMQGLNELREQGSPVFVNMTAAWCITCLANEKVALSTAQLKQYFADNKIVYLKGDWTNQDASITQYLESFGRSSVPLYVYYPAGNANEPSVLPQILTAASVIDFIESATNRADSSL